jgi:hypothetical protein
LIRRHVENGKSQGDLIPLPALCDTGEILRRATSSVSSSSSSEEDEEKEYDRLNDKERGGLEECEDRFSSLSVFFSGVLQFGHVGFLIVHALRHPEWNKWPHFVSIFCFSMGSMQIEQSSI